MPQTTLLASHRVPQLLVASVFLVGFLLAALSILANETQTSYYRAARDLKRKLEDELAVDDFALTTTPGMGSGIRRLGRVGTFLKVMLAAIAVTDLIGVGLIAHGQWFESPPQRVVVVIGGRSGTQNATNRPSTVVIAREGDVVAQRTRNAAGTYRNMVLEPGRYELWAANRSACHRQLWLTDAPVQLVAPHC